MNNRKDETSYKQTSFGIIPRSKLIRLEIEGIKRAWDFVLQKRDAGEIPITPEFIKKIHYAGFGWIFPENSGKFRTFEVRVSHYIPPKHYLITQLLTDFAEDLKIRIKKLPEINNDNFLNEIVSLLSWAHHRFLWIHPFFDYNGRIARLLNNIILINLNLPPIELKVETKKGREQYIKALQDADNNNLNNLEKIIKSAIIEATKELK